MTELFKPDTENSEYVAYLNKKGRSLYSNGSHNQRSQVLQNNNNQFLIDLKACVCCYVRLESGLYYVSKAEVFKNAREHKITYKVVKSTTTNNDFYLIVY